MEKLGYYFIFVFVSILAISSMSCLVYAEEKTYDLSATLRKEVDLGDQIKFDMFLRSSVTYVIPNKVNAGDNSTLEFALKPASAMFFLEISAIDQTYYTENEVNIQEGNPIEISDGVTLVFNLSPSVELSVIGPATLNQSKFAWENFLDRQMVIIPVFLNASGKNDLIINSDFYLNVQVSVYVQLENYTTEIINYPLPKLQMSPRISHSIEVIPEPTFVDQIIKTITEPLFIVIGVILITFTVVIVFFNRKRKLKKRKATETAVKESETIEKQESIIRCNYCGKEVPKNSTYCNRCGKKIGNNKETTK